MPLQDSVSVEAPAEVVSTSVVSFLGVLPCALCSCPNWEVPLPRQEVPAAASSLTWARRWDPRGFRGPQLKTLTCQLPFSGRYIGQRTLA